MSWHYLLGQEGVYLQADSLDGTPYVLSKLMSTANVFCCRDSATECYSDSQSGTIYGHLTDAHGAVTSMSLAGASPAKHSAVLRMAKTRQKICGQKCSELSEKYYQHTSSPKMSAKTRSLKHKRTLKKLDLSHVVAEYRRKTWVVTTYGQDIGYLPTPTTKANWAADSMQKWPSSRLAVKIFGRPSPETNEWLMGWPIGWTDLRPLGMDKFQRWQRSHGLCCPRVTEVKRNSKTIKAIFTADVHMSNTLPFSTVVENGCSDRLLDQLSLWKKIYKVIKKKGAQCLVILGDLFDRSKVDAVTLTHTVSSIVNCPVPVFILPGNHDASTMSGGRFTVEAFSSMDKQDVTVIGLKDKNEWGMGGDDVVFWPISFRTISETEKTIMGIKGRMKDWDNNILLLHGSILGADSYGWKCDDGLDPKIFEGFDQVLAGHFHQTQSFSDNGFYVGSPMQHHFGDCGSDCGVWLAEFNKGEKNKFEYIKIRTPKFHIFDYDEFSVDILKKKKYKGGDFIRFNVVSTHADFVKKKVAVEETCRLLTDKGFKVNYRHKQISQTNERISIAKKDGIIQLDSAVSKYVKSTQTELKPEQLIRLGKEILEGVRCNS